MSQTRFGAGGALEVVKFQLSVDPSAALAGIGEINRLLTTYIALARKVGLPENVIDAIATLQQMRVAAETAYRSIMILSTVSGPFGWLLTAGGLALSAGMVIDMELRRSRY